MRQTKIAPPTAAEFARIFEHLMVAYNVASEEHAFLCAHHYQKVGTNPYVDLGYFTLNRALGYFPAPLFVRREDYYFPHAIAA